MITLATLNDATAQQVFDQVARHLLTQNTASLHDGGCSYRGDNGTKCAIGCLIGDDEYRYRMEENTWVDLINQGIVRPTTHDDLLSSLQVIHDSCGSAEWNVELCNLAILFKLNPSVIEEFGV